MGCSGLSSPHHLLTQLPQGMPSAGKRGPTQLEGSSWMGQEKVMQELNLCSLIISGMLPSQEANLDQLGLQCPHLLKQGHISAVRLLPMAERAERKRALLSLHGRALKSEGSTVTT